MASDKDALNAGLAEALAPVLGEEAVYDIQADRIIPVDDRNSTLIYSRVSKDFTDPAVLWPLWERWDIDHDWTVTIYRKPVDGFEATVWQDKPGYYRKGASTTEAVARAWHAALMGVPADA